jgi:acyl carrier protein
MNNIQDRLNRIIVKSTGKKDLNISPDMRLVEDLKLDSLGIIDLLTDIEIEFGIMLPEDERLVSVRTVNDMYAALQAAVSKATQAVC